MASTCPTAKGEGKDGGKNSGGKNGGFKGKGKGWSDSKGKGKGGWYNPQYANKGEKGDKGKGKGKSINGKCNSCGVFGHMARDCWSAGKGAVNFIEEQQQDYYEPYNTSPEMFTGSMFTGFPLCALEAHQWKEVEHNKKSNTRKVRRTWIKLDMNNSNMFEELQDQDDNFDEKTCRTSTPLGMHMDKNGKTCRTSTPLGMHKDKNGENIVKMDIMPITASVKETKMKAVGKGRITIDSSAAESVIPLGMLKQVPFHTNDQEKMNTVYTAADGGQMWNHGDKFASAPRSRSPWRV